MRMCKLLRNKPSCDRFLPPLECFSFRMRACEVTVNTSSIFFIDASVLSAELDVSLRSAVPAVTLYSTRVIAFSCTYYCGNDNTTSADVSWIRYELNGFLRRWQGKRWYVCILLLFVQFQCNPVLMSITLFLTKHLLQVFVL